MKRLDKLMLLLLFFLSLFAGGCWNYKRMDQLGIVAGVGIDLGQTPESVLLTIQVIKPGEVIGDGGDRSSGAGGQGGQPRPVVIIESEGATVYEAIRNAVTKYSRKLYWPHNQILIIGKEAAAKGVRGYIDLFIRDAEPRPTAWILVARGKAGEIIKAPGKMEKVSAMEIAKLVQAQSATSQAGGFTIHDFVNRLLSKTAAPLATEILLDKESEIKLVGTAIFKGDKLVDFIGKKETRGLLWLIDKVQSGIVVVEAPEDKGKMTLELIRSDSKVKAEIKGENILFKAKVDVHSNLGAKTGEIDLAEPEMLRSLARWEATAIRNEINAAIRKAKELNADIFGFGEIARRANHKAWKRFEPRWDKIFPNLKVDLIVKTNISRVGLTFKPIKPK